MTNRTKRLLIGVSVGLCLLLAVSVWATIRVVAWASDLPNRIDVQTGGKDVTWFIAESARVTLESGSRDQQLETLKALTEGIKTNPEVVPWVQTELESEIAMLRESPDPKVAALAEDLHSKIAAPGNARAGG